MGLWPQSGPQTRPGARSRRYGPYDNSVQNRTHKVWRHSEALFTNLVVVCSKSAACAVAVTRQAFSRQTCLREASSNSRQAIRGKPSRGKSARGQPTGGRGNPFRSQAFLAASPFEESGGVREAKGRGSHNRKLAIPSFKEPGAPIDLRRWGAHVMYHTRGSQNTWQMHASIAPVPQAYLREVRPGQKAQDGHLRKRGRRQHQVPGRGAGSHARVVRRVGRASIREKCFARG